MSNTVTIVITETEDGVSVAISCENPTKDNSALIAAISMVASFKESCESDYRASLN